jgi:hypothetical protein
MLTNWAATQQRTGTMMGFESNSRFLRKTIKQSEDERLPPASPIWHCPVLSTIAHSLHLQRTCSGYPRITRLLLHHSFFFLPFSKSVRFW